MTTPRATPRSIFLVTCATAAAAVACSGSSGSSVGGVNQSSASSSGGAAGGSTSSGASGTGTGSSSGAGASSGTTAGASSTSGSSSGSTGVTGSSGGGSTSGGGTSSGDAGVASKCPGYAAPPALGTTISLAPTSSSTAEKVLPLGCMHLLSNRWTDPMATETLFLDTNSSFGWTWNRGSTGATTPNYPEIEFGVNPWGESMNGDLTPVSTTDLLPMQLQDIHSASMTVSVDANIASAGLGWNLAFEMWLAPGDPTKAPSTPKFEIMVFFGNHANYYPTSPTCDKSASSYDCGMQVQDGSNSYTLYFASENWGSPAYTYLQFRDSGDASSGQFTGTLNIYKFLQAVNPPGNLYVTRFELGDETSQGCQGATTIKNIAFEVNGTTEAALMKY